MDFDSVINSVSLRNDDAILYNEMIKLCEEKGIKDFDFLKPLDETTLKLVYADFLKYKEYLEKYYKANGKGEK